MRVQNKTCLLILALLLLLGIIYAQDTSGENDTNPQGETSPDNDNDTEADKGEDEEEDDDEEEKKTDQQGSDNPKEIKVGEYYKINATLTFNGNYQPAGYFQFKIGDKVENRDLVIMVTGRQDFTHNPALFYSLSNKFPDLSKPDDVSCGLTGHDFCIIPQEKISNNQVYYLGVHCIKSCKFDIYVQYDPLFKQMLNNQVMYESVKDTPYVLEVQITIPNDLDPNVEHILIESYILNFNQVTTNFNMYVNKGLSRPSSSSYDYVTEELKLNGQSVLLEKSIDKFTPGQVYTLAIDVPPKAKMLVRSESFEKVRTLFFFKSVDDMVRRGQVRIFKLEISPFTMFEWDKEELSIDLEPYFGNPDLYVNHGSLPDDPTNLSSYRWSSTEQDGLESLTITKGSINNKSLVGEVFYIAVYGESAASFRLLGYSSSIEQRQIDFNCVENGYTMPNEIVNYQLPLDEEEGDSDITVKLTTIQGDTSLFVKRCIDIPKIEDCQVSMADINSKTLQEPEFRRSVEVSKNHKIDFKYVKSECQGANGLNKCTYIVGVLGASKGQNKYRLIAKHTIQPIQLRENEDHRSFLLESEKEYYRFTVNQEDETIIKVEFSITSISGELAVYSSRKNPFPDQADNEKAEIASQDQIIYHKSNKNPSLKGTYYIGVQALSGCIYSIYAKIYRHKKDVGVIANMKQIEMGIVEKGYLSYMNPHQYYFTVDPLEITESHQTNIVLYFNGYKNGTIPSLRINPQIQISYQVNKTTFYNVTRYQEDYISSDFIYMKIYTNYTENGKYIITMSHKDEAHKASQIKYQLNVNAHNIIYIVPRGAYIQDLSQADLNNYELYLYEPAKVYIELFECFGKVKIQAASSIDKIESKNFDIKSSMPSRFIGDHTIVNFERNSKGPLYLAVQPQSTDTTQINKSLYRIIPHIINKKSVIPHDVFQTPSEGQISTDVSFYYDEKIDQYVSQINITYGTIECANGCQDSIYKPQDYTYFIHVTNKDNYMQYFAKCGMDVSDLSSLGIQNTSDTFYSQRYKNIKGDTQPDSLSEQFSFFQNGTYYVEIMGVVYLETNYTKNILEPFTFIYPMKQFVVGDPSTGTPNIIEKTEEKYILPLFIMIPIGIALLALLIIIIYKQIKTFIIRRRYRLAMMMQDKNPEVETADKEKEGAINDDDEKQNKKKVDKINFLN